MSDILITPADLKIICPHAKADVLAEVAPAMTEQLPKFDIMTLERICGWIGQAAVETAEFTTLQEMGGRDYFTRMYEHRADLGNRAGTGDGARFHGRGVFQLTGRSNYATYAELTGLDLIGNPDLAASGTGSVMIACLYWNKRGISPLADARDWFHVSAKINGINRTTGEPNHLKERIQYTERALRLYGG